MGMRLNYLLLPDFEGTIQNSGRLRVFLDPGPTYEEFTLEWSGEVADIAAFVVKVNNEERVRISGQQMLDREAYDGRSATANSYVFSFSDPVARTFQGDAMTGLCTKPTDRVLVEVELNSTGIAGTETIKLYAETSPFRLEEYKLFCVPELVPINQTGDNDYNGFRRGDFPRRAATATQPGRPPHIALRRAFNYGNITHFELEQDGRYPFGDGKLPKATNDARLKRNGKTVPTSSTCYVFDPVVKGNVIFDLFDTWSARSLRAKFTTGDSNGITSLVEYVESVTPAAA